jgi:2-C-methyl-D-erythritol 4-phosphate cytidylyltransferase
VDNKKAVTTTKQEKEFLFKQHTKRINYPSLFCYKKLHDCFQAESGCSTLTLLGNGHQKPA